MKIQICRQLDKLCRLVIPKDLREQYGLKPGDRVWFSGHDDGILIHSESGRYHNGKPDEA